jgi:ribosomal subunit interface protein
METPAEVIWHNMDPIPHVARRVDERIARLEKFFDRIVSCRVVVEAAHQRHRKGNQYEVRVDVVIPGGDLSINRRPGDDEAHADLRVTIRDAFDAMERQLRRWKDEHSGRPVIQEAPLQGRVAEIDHDEDFGHIDTADGRSIYFHSHSVVSGDFAALNVGDVVELVVAPRDDAEGLHASTVRPIGGQRFVGEPG